MHKDFLQVLQSSGAGNIFPDFFHTNGKGKNAFFYQKKGGFRMKKSGKNYRMFCYRRAETEGTARY